MQIKVDNIKLSLEDRESLLKEKLKKRLNKEIQDYTILKKSLDARGNEAPFFIYQLLVNCTLSEKELKKLEKKGVSLYQKKEEMLVFGTEKMTERPIIVGFGPSGLFCAYELAKHGYRPLVLEQGESVYERVKSVEHFWQTGKLDEHSNVQFGEGGAGTFSDGKLTSRSKSPLVSLVLETFVSHGAPKEVMYDKKPHIGTDLLRPVIYNMREQIKKWGGEVRFRTAVSEILVKDMKTLGVKLVDGTIISSNTVILAMGHSSRDLFRSLYQTGIQMESKPFAVGFRIEHLQDFINEHQYGQYKDKLPAADYQLAFHNKTENRGVYTFCMCPGGEVVLASSEKGRMVVNGMSYHKRDLPNANSAVLVSVDERDYGNGVLSGIVFQESLEEKVFKLTGKANVAPVQKVSDFLKRQKTTKLGKITPSVCQYQLSELSNLLPKNLYQSFCEGLIALDKKFSNFAATDAILTAMETRSSSPVKILRDRDTYESLSHQGLYPAGEGAGYAGGIVSSAIDGIKVARSIMRKYDTVR